MARPNVGVRVAALCVGLAFSPSALGLPTFPGEVAKQTGSPCIPQCVLCHLDNNGGPLNTNFGRVIQREGGLLTQPDEVAEGVEFTASVAAALAQLAARNVNSDGEGATDVEELAQGLHPTAPGDATVCGPQYGCGARIARSDGRDAAPSGLAAVVAVLLGALCLRRLRAPG